MLETLFQSFPAVEETHDHFLNLFPHRFDYIFAPHSDPGQTPDWQTESRHPLSDRLIGQGTFLYGVRFGAKTFYALLDIDRGSLYHPTQDPLAIGRILSTLEPLGLVSAVTISSSYSGGLHLYLPFQQAQSSWELAIAISTSLENAGYRLLPGQLEIFPNPKPYAINGKPSLFNAHRLPLQAGSYLLDSTFQPIYSTKEIFVQQWKLAQFKNDLDTATLRRIIKQAKRRIYHISGKADKFINDLNAEIETGWTGHGQTNYILGRITMREYIFHHLIHGGNPLEGKELIETIVQVVRSLPGYQEWCRHQHELEHRVEEWVRCIENSKYFHYGAQKGKYGAKHCSETSTFDHAIQKLPNYKQQQSEAARERIRMAIAILLETESLPSSTTARFRLLTQQYKIGGATLYRHRNLWHPQYLLTSESASESITGSITEPLVASTTNSCIASTTEPLVASTTNSCIASTSDHLTRLTPSSITSTNTAPTVTIVNTNYTSLFISDRSNSFAGLLFSDCDQSGLQGSPSNSSSSSVERYLKRNSLQGQMVAFSEFLLDLLLKGSLNVHSYWAAFQHSCDVFSQLPLLPVQPCVGSGTLISLAEAIAAWSEVSSDLFGNDCLNPSVELRPQFCLAAIQRLLRRLLHHDDVTDEWVDVFSDRLATILVQGRWLDGSDTETAFVWRALGLLLPCSK
jgi:hypothetical protein